VSKCWETEAHIVNVVLKVKKVKGKGLFQNPKQFHCYIHHTAQMQQLKPKKKKKTEGKESNTQQQIFFSSVAGIFLRYVSSISTKAQIGWEV
jgi:hypothetical protein